MKIVYTIIISVLIAAVICVILGLLQYYYVNDINFKINSGVQLDVPIFEDMIAREDRYNIVDNYDDWQNREMEILNSLHDDLNSATTTTETPVNPLRNGNYLTTDSEVQHVLQAALSFKLAGKMEKAMKLFEHAAAIAPQNPDVLNHYGEFIENMHNNVMVADHLYFKALVHSPDHTAALINRKRTAHVVDKIDLEIFKAIDEKRDLLVLKQKSNLIHDTVKKQAYYLHIFHTVGIEGNTLTLEQLTILLQTGQAAGGKSLLEYNEILGLELAMKYVKLLTRFPTIGVTEILGIHRRILAHVDPFNAGTFRNEQVFAGGHIPPPPKDLPGLMSSYVEWLNSEEAQSMHPIMYAALAHYKLVDIHPFADGNGRTSRLIMNLILLRTGYPPVMILKHQREKYYQTLNIANEGDVRLFVRFIAHCTETTLEFYLKRTDSNSGTTHIKTDTIEITEENRNL